jgi:hypothetical protein
LHFEKRQSGREAGISGTAANAGTSGIAYRFDRERRRGTALHGPRNPGLNWFVENSGRQALRGSCGFSGTRCGGGTLGSFAFAAIATTSTAATAAFFVRRVRGFSGGFREGFLDIGFGFNRSGRSFERCGSLFR